MLNIKVKQCDNTCPFCTAEYNGMFNDYVCKLTGFYILNSRESNKPFPDFCPLLTNSSIVVERE